MQVVSLVSGGKDSCYNMMECVRAGHSIVALAHLYPPTGAEMDSFMYQTVGSEAVSLYAEAMGLPLFKRPIVGASHDTGSADHYTSSANSGDTSDEVEDLYKLLSDVKANLPNVQAVSVGAILSNYQRVRVESVCDRLGLQVFAFLWRRDQVELLDEMLSSGLDAILIKVAAYGLSPKRHLGRRLADLRNDLVDLSDPASAGLSPCGEGGEYETLALDCPLFRYGRLAVDSNPSNANDPSIVVHSNDAFAPVCYLNLNTCCRLAEPKAGLNHQPGRQIDQLAPIDRISSILIQREFKLDAENYKTNRHFLTEATMPKTLKRSPALIPFSVVNVAVLSDDVELKLNDTESAARLLLARATTALKTAENGCLRPLLCILTVPDMSAFSTVNAVYGSPELGFATQPGRSPPARACIELKPTRQSNYLMTASILAIVNDSSSKLESRMVTSMHVRSRSHWAPANIGPYSQCTVITSNANDSLEDDSEGNSTSRLLLISGQIGMDPATLEVPKDSSAIWQAELALRHTLRVARANGYSVSLSSAANLFVCFGIDTDCLLAGVEAFHRLVCQSNASNGRIDCQSCSALILPVLCHGLPKGAKVEWLSLLTDGIENCCSATRLAYFNDMNNLPRFIADRKSDSCNNLAICLINEATPVTGVSESCSRSTILGCPILWIRCVGFLDREHNTALGAIAMLQF